MLSAFLGIYYIFTIIHSIVTVCPNDDEDSRCSDQFFVLLPPDHTKCINVEFTQCLAPKDAFNCSESIVTAITPTLVALECYSALVAYDTDIINGPPMVLYGNSSSVRMFLCIYIAMRAVKCKGGRTYTRRSSVRSFFNQCWLEITKFCILYSVRGNVILGNDSSQTSDLVWAWGGGGGGGGWVVGVRYNIVLNTGGPCPWPCVQ